VREGTTSGAARRITPYIYRRADGEIAYWHVRKRLDEEPWKRFWYETPDEDSDTGRRSGLPADADSILFMMPQLLDALSNPATAQVAWCEGEKDAQRVVREWGIPATSHHSGRGVADEAGWAFAERKDYRGEILIIADDDENDSGLYTAQRKVEILYEAGFDSHVLKVLLPARGKDVSDHIDAGLGLADMREMGLAELKARAPTLAALNAGGWYGEAAERVGDLGGESLKPSDIDQPSGARKVPDVPESAEVSTTADLWADEDEEEEEEDEVVAAQDFARNDTGNADLLHELHGTDIAWIPDLAEWFCWNGNYWRADAGRLDGFCRDVGAERRRAARAAKGKAAEALASFAVSCGNDARIQAMLRRAASRQTRRAVEFDADPSLLVVRNGTIELGAAGVRFREHRQADLITAVTTTLYDPAAQSDLWDDFLGRFVPDKGCQDYLQRLAGYSLLGANPQRVLIFLIGPTSTGKTTFVSLMQKTLGRALSGTFSLAMFRSKRDDAPRPDILKAMTRRMIFAEEASSEWNLHADTIKQVTSHGQIEARGMRSNLFVERMPLFTPWIATNDLPEIRHADSAVKRRLIAFPFRQQVVSDQDDHGFIERIGPADRAAILAWLVRGYEAYCRKLLNAMPPAVSAETEHVRMSVSPYDQFLADRCETGAGFETASAELYSDFENWWTTEGLRGQDKPTQTAFGRALADRGFESDRDEHRRYRKGLQLIGSAGQDPLDR
jgi:putative DNA primase/helicase